jgi:hypothetical protein
MALSDGGGDQEAVMWARIGRMECGLVSHREGYCRFLHHGDPNPYFQIGHALSCHYLLTGSILWSFFLELWAEQLIRGDIGRAYSGAMCWSARRGEHHRGGVAPRILRHVQKCKHLEYRQYRRHAVSTIIEFATGISQDVEQ